MDPEVVESDSPTMTMDEEMASDWKAIQAKYAEPSPEKTPEPEPPAPAEPEKIAVQRDDRGKFTKSERDAGSKAPSPVNAPDPAASAPAPTPEPAATPRDINRAPSSWKPAAKAAWAALPEDVRAEIQRREGDFLNGQAGLMPDAQLGKSIRDITAPYKALMDAEGGSPESAMRDYLKTASILRMGTPQQKLQAVMGIAQQFGIPLPQAAAIGQQPAPQAAPQQFRDPRVDQMLADQAQREQQRQAAERATLEATSESWLNENDAAGKPLRPYVDNVMTEMSALVPLIRDGNPSLSHSEVLQRAYEQAIWAHPEIRPILLKEQTDRAEADRLAENQQRVNQAKRASSVNVPRRAASPSPGKPGTIDDTIRETARSLGFFST